MKQKVWIVTGKSESGDSYGPLAYDKKPSKAVLKRLAFSWDAGEGSDGPGDFGSYVYLDVTQVEVQTL